MDVRPITSKEYPTFQRTFTRAMGFPPPTDAYLERWQGAISFDRSLAAFDRDQIVGTAYSYLFELTVPGGAQIDAAGVTAVGVLSTHRRRGIVTQLMRRQLAEARDRGEPLAILIASESVIYGRYGYGPSSYLMDVEIDTQYRAYREPFRAERVYFVDEETADKVFPEVHERWRKQQPGAIPRSEVWWANAAADRKPGQDYLLIHEDDSGGVDAFARYTIHSKWEQGLAASTVDLHDLISLSPDATKSLWRHVLDVDLVRTVKAWARPVDDPVRWWLANPRALKVSRLGDLFWTRLLDIPRSLAARTYRADGELILEIDDPQFEDNNGRFALTVWGGKARCDRSDKSPDLAMSVAALGSLYLGGVAASEIARGGRIRELREGALEKADAAFSSSPKPWSSTWF